jgi:hypothetical protein
MAYIGRGIENLINAQKLDAITPSTATGVGPYNLTQNSVAFVPASADALVVSINGVVQYGNFTISGSTITFSGALTDADTCDFIYQMGTGLLNTPADGTVNTAQLADDSVTTAKILDSNITLAKLSATGTKDATTFLRGDNTFADVSSINTDLVNDTTPQLGGSLDVNGNSIVSVSNGNISITPDGTGKVILDGLSHPTADGTNGQALVTDGSGNLSFGDVSVSLSAVGESIIPSTTDTYDLGATSFVWRNIYTGDLHLSNEAKEEGNSVDGTKGNWTIQEGSEDLFIVNNKSGKKYKFKLEEI